MMKPRLLLPSLAVVLRITAVTAMLLLSACSWFGGSVPDRSLAERYPSTTLAELPQATLPAKSTVTPETLNVIADGYRAALELIQDPLLREDILRRLALLDLRGAEEQHIVDERANPTELYRNAISTYQTLLAAQNYRSDNDKLLYPLAKAYELSGDIPRALQVFNQLVADYPDSIYYSESQFRRGEILFAAADYRNAGQAYRAVVERNEETPFLMNAWYMSGWSDFKLGRYEQALKAFVVVLDNEYAQQDTADISQSRQAIIDDTFRVMSLSFSYTQGPSSIAALLDELGERDYSDRLFADLGQLYLSKKRYRDSVDVFASYIARYPQSPLAPAFHVRQIDAYGEGRFPDQVREQKKHFATTYGVEGEYWSTASGDNREYIKERLRLYINELAAYYHNLAQTQKALLTAKKGQSSKKDQVSKTVRIADVQALYSEAGDWYEQWIRSFPDEPDLANSWFLLGETRFESADFIAAITAYENAAYGYTDKDLAAGFEKAHEAGYAALLSYDQVLLELSKQPESETQHETTQYQQWQYRKIDSALLFANSFPNDQRRLPVLAQATELLLGLEDYPRTVEVATLLINGSDVAGQQSEHAELLLTGWLSLAHAQSALADYPAAEAAYQSTLGLLATDPQSPQYAKYYNSTLDNYAASIYKQGELANADGATELAASTFLRVVELAPNSAIRVTAQHDAGVLLMQMAQWQAAIDIISDFQQRFPQHPETATIPARLLQANQALGNWSGAAEQAMVIADTDSDAEARRQALYTAAEFYDKAEDTGNAIDKYRRYAHEYHQPLAERMEAQFRLTQLYADQREKDKRRFWLKQLIDAHSTAAQKTERSSYLAAFSSTDIAEEHLQAYYRVSLKHPLKSSLQKKRKALKKAVDSYEKVASFGVEEFATQSTHRIGEIYAVLAKSLMDSERPKGLSELELEQYNFLLEEQAFPFEEQAIAFYTINVERAWTGSRTEWIKASYQSLAELLPARFGKQEIRP